MGSDNCHKSAQCTNTEENFTSSCHPGDGTECSVVLTVVLVFAGVLVFIAVLLMNMAILCGSICVAHKLWEMNAKRFVTGYASSKQHLSHINLIVRLSFSLPPIFGHLMQSRSCRSESHNDRSFAGILQHGIYMITVPPVSHISHALSSAFMNTD